MSGDMQTVEDLLDGRPYINEVDSTIRDRTPQQIPQAVPGEAGDDDVVDDIVHGSGEVDRRRRRAGPALLRRVTQRAYPHDNESLPNHNGHYRCTSSGIFAG
jgi:hypothetical protein